MNMEILMQYITYALIAIGALAFLVSVITQVIKEMPGLANIQTNAVAFAVALIICPVALIIACKYFNIIITWYYVFASFIAAFIVYLVSTGGWERVAEMWRRTRWEEYDPGTTEDSEDV